MSFNFGAQKTGTGFTLPTTSAPTISSSAGGAGDAKLQNKPSGLFSTPPASTGFSLGGAAPATGFSLNSATPTTGFSLSAASPATGFMNTAPKTNPSLNFGVSTPATATPKLSFTSTPVSSVAATQFSLGAATATTSAPPFMSIARTGTSIAGAAPATSVSTSAGLQLTTSLPAATVASTVGLSLGTTAATTQAVPSTTTATSVVPTSTSLTYAQLEDSINKWTIDLEEQGKFFINQAKQLNAWDSLLLSNGEKISTLNETIERVKQQQKQLDQELDFVLAQQNELDELSLPLEKQLADIPISDQNRFQMYQLSEIVDSQLKQMSEDLKEIVEHLNESNKTEDISDPVTQVSRILNAHMNSLQWVDRNSAQISSHLEQVSKQHELLRKNHLNI